MAKFILRLDDACPEMDIYKWDRMERILDRYQIEPIVGIIPQNEDETFTFPYDEMFWSKACKWQAQHWTIAQHGYTHKVVNHPRRGYYYLAVETITEFAGVSYERQKEMLRKGKEAMKAKGVFPTCFFAPAHTFDYHTVKAISEDPDYKFISDGHALHAYEKDHCVFVPSIFDGLHIIGGVQTFIFHPTYMKEEDFEHLEAFLKLHGEDFINAEDYVDGLDVIPRQGCVGKLFEVAIYVFRRTKLLLHGEK